MAYDLIEKEKAEGTTTRGEEDEEEAKLTTTEDVEIKGLKSISFG
jgi:hypothetical protein